MPKKFNDDLATSFSIHNTRLPYKKSRREFIKQLLSVTGAITIGSTVSACGTGVAINKMFRTSSRTSYFSKLGELQPADQNGLMLPKGFSSRIVARSNEAPLATSDFLWHWAPDGGAVFPTKEGGRIYVSNSEMSAGAGGASALTFDANGRIVAANSILNNTNRNCGGGMTPWGTWLSCEEIRNGKVWECDPMGIKKAKLCDAMGYFTHEAIGYDVKNNHIYMTEDEPDGCFYRFIPTAKTSDGKIDLSKGLLEVAVLESEINENNGASKIAWRRVPDPFATSTQTRYQLEDATAFNGLEGIDYFDGRVFVTEKGTNRVYQLDLTSQILSVIYDAENFDDPILEGVDNLVVAPTGDIAIAEDGGNMQIVMLTTDAQVLPIVQIVGHDNSEITGPAFTPDGKYLYFSSQRGTSGTSGGGMTFEVKGMFFN